MAGDAKSAALRLVLSKRRTEKEVCEALVEKGFSAEDAEDAASYYRENGYINHEEYARRFAHDAALIKGHGPERIRRDLSVRGVEAQIIEDALSLLSFDVTTPMEKRFGRGVKSEKEHAQIYGYFLRKGFHPGDIRKAMDALYTYE